MSQNVKVNMATHTISCLMGFIIPDSNWNVLKITFLNYNNNKRWNILWFYLYSVYKENTEQSLK